MPDSVELLPSNLDHELYRVQGFMDAVSRVSEITPNATRLDLAEEDPLMAAINRFETYERRGHTTLYLAEQVGLKSIDPSWPISFSPLVSRGGKHSFHGVFFGDLEIGTDVHIQVAVKPHMDEEHITSCLGEVLNNDAVQSLGFHTLSNVGFIIESGQAYSMTVLDDTLDTLDSLDWSEFYPDLDNNPAMRDMWRKLAQQAGFLHAFGSNSHGDLAARNAATTNDGSLFIIDWEKARLSLQPPRDAETRYAHSHLDLSVLLESMCRPAHVDFKPGIGMFYGKQTDWWEGFKQVFFDEYKNVRFQEISKKNLKVRHHTRKQAEKDIFDELTVLEATLKEDARMQQAICASI